ncbi:MAG: glycogen synthase [Calditrichia bacterium]
MNPLKVCYVSSEVVPFTPSGELAFYSKSLPVALKEMDQDIRLMMPKYKSINERKFVLREVIRLREVNVSLNDDNKPANGKTAFLPNSKVHVYFLSVPEYFDKKGVYSDPKTGKIYKDNAERFGYFCKGVLETLKLLYWQPDIIHCGGWSSSLIPYYLKNHFKDDEFFANTRTVLTIHNFREQGEFSMNVAQKIGIDEELLAKGQPFEANGKFNFLKGGLHYADVINTVSEDYCASITDNPKTKVFGLEEALAGRKKDFYGIANGTSYGIWNPETDAHLPQTFDSKSLDLKSESKQELREELQLPEENLPIIGFVSGIEEDSGLDLFMESLDDLLKQKLQLVVGGISDEKLVESLQKIAKKHPEKMAVIETMDKSTHHLLTAAADIMLFPTPIAGGGNYHLSCMKYGTVPVAHAVGALADAVKPFDGETGKGNGFTFDAYKKAPFLKAIKTALKAQTDEKLWAKAQKNGMRQDFSWENTAKKYQKLYEKALKKK